MATVTEDQWRAKGVELFGDDMSKWRFQCPACGGVASVEIAKKDFPTVEGAGWHPESECIGRYLPKGNCDWCAYGLIRGPLFVARPNGARTPIFDFEGNPFTSDQRNPNPSEGGR